MNELRFKLSDVIEKKIPEYVFLKVTPSVSIRNYNSDILVSMVAKLFLSMGDRLRNIDGKLVFEDNVKLGYYVYMEKGDTQFYFVVPKNYYYLFHDKITSIWADKIGVVTADEIPLFEQDCTKYYLTYKNLDALSLSCDKRNNDLLSNQLNTLHIMEKGDKVGIFYNFVPVRQRSWKAKYDHAIEDMTSGNHIYLGKSKAVRAALFALDRILDLVDIVLDCVSFGGGSSKPSAQKKISALELSKSSIDKKNSDVVASQILCFSKSQDPDREINNALSVCNSFDCLSENNALIYKKLKSKNVNLLETIIKGASQMLVQSKEGQNFISLPARSLLTEYKNDIGYIALMQTQVPEQLQHGYICVGTNEFHECKTQAYLRDNYDMGNWPLVLIGEQDCGKTTFIVNYVHDILQRGEGAIVPDFIKNCELSDAISKIVPKDKLIILDMCDIKSAQGIGYNELKPKNNDPMELLDIANRKCLYVQMLIDAVNVGGDPLSSSMDKYFTAASNIVFLNSDASLKDVIHCLNDHRYRKECIENIPKELINDLDDDIASLQELDDYGRGNVVIGTHNYKVDGINHRINLLKKDLRLKMMFNKGCDDNLDLVSAMNEGKIILIKMPQEYFSTPYSKNVVVTYWLTKVWCAMSVRGSVFKQPKRFHVIIDEFFQAKTAMQMLKDQEILPQTRKYGCRYVLSCQYLYQMEVIKNTLWASGSSYMIMKGSSQSNYNDFKNDIAPFTLETLQDLPQWYSLNLINYEVGRAKFITALPKPIV